MSTIIHELTPPQLDRILHLMPQIGSASNAIRIEHREQWVRKSKNAPGPREPGILLKMVSIPLTHCGRDYDFYASFRDRDTAEAFLQKYWDNGQSFDWLISELEHIYAPSGLERIERGELHPALMETEMVEAIVYCLDSEVGLVPYFRGDDEDLYDFGLVVNDLFLAGAEWVTFGASEIKRLYVAIEQWKGSGKMAVASSSQRRELRKPEWKDRAFSQVTHFYNATTIEMTLDELREAVARELLTIRLGVYGITVTFADGKRVSGEISSDLLVGEQPNSPFHAVEAMILACACAGIDIETAAFKEAIESTVDAVGNQLD